MNPTALGIADLRIETSCNLRNNNSFAVPANAKRLLRFTSAQAVQQAWQAQLFDNDAFVIGAGSNLLWVNDPDCSVLQMQNQGQQIVGTDDSTVYVQAQAGGSWHDLVCWSVQQQLWGIENLALIPGTVGAAPIQNIGAYGVEVADVIDAVQVFDRSTGDIHWRTADACDFGYRDSIFKQQAQRWIVLALRLRLSRRARPQLDYAGLRQALAAAPKLSAQTIADAVITIRRSKLPDPATLGNAGSFFKNPIVPTAQAQALLQRFAAMPCYRTADAGLCKLSAAWLIEHAGLKGFRQGDAGIYAHHALVLVNYGNATGLQLLALARHIAAQVAEKFGVALVPEPRLIGADWP